MTLRKVAGFLFVIVGLCLTTNLTAQMASSISTNEIRRGNVTLPFTLRQGYLIVVEGSLGSLSGRRLVIDTGTTSTVLNCSVARQLGLGGQESHLTLLNGDERARTSVLSSLTLGPIVAKSVPAFVADLSFLTKQLGMHIDGIVGLDVLKSSNFRIDYDAREIVFGPVQPSPASVPFESEPPLVTVTTEIEGHPVRLLVDTGASGLLLFRGDQRWMERQAIVREHASSNIAGMFTRDEVQFSEVRLGRLRMRSQTAYLVRARKASAPEFEGLLGVGTMGLKEITFDFEHHQLEVKPGK